MSKFREIYGLANRLGLDLLPSSASDEEQMQNIAEQLGIDYDGTPGSEMDLLDSLRDMEEEEMFDEDPNDNGYDEDRIDNYGREKDQSKAVEKKAPQDDQAQGQEGADRREGSDLSKGDEDSGDGKNNGDSSDSGDSGEQGERNPNDNGYDPNRSIEDSEAPGEKNPASKDGSSHSGQEPAYSQGDNSPSSRNGLDEDTPKTKPGETNPNNDINRNGSRPDLNENGYQGRKVQNAQNAQSQQMGSRNYQHNKRVQNGKKSEESQTSSSKTDSKNPSDKTKGKNIFSKDSEKGKSGLTKKESPQEKAKKKAKQLKRKQRRKKMKENLVKIAGFLMRHPFLLFIIVLVLLFILIILAIISDGDITGAKGGNGRKNCTYNLAGVTSTGEVELTGLEVELINCDGTASDYTVLETVDFEKYVLGVALAEIGPDSPDEAIKAQIVAARNFALTRNSGMCPSNPDDCFYGYNASTGKIRMRACEADQVYWDYNEIIYRQDRGAISLYSPEIDSGTIWKHALSDEKKTHVLELAEDVKGKVLLDDDGDVFPTSYTNVESEKFMSGAEAGDSYDKILSDVYGVSNMESARCAAAGNIDYGDYTLSSDGIPILHEPLDSFLEDNGSSLEEFNELIKDNVEEAGFGTRAGVVAAAVTLIGELGDNYNVKVPYYWGGGHYDGVVVGALGYWGSDADCTTFANGQTYDYCGLDCSGFVPWAIKNGGFNTYQRLAGDFKNINGAEKVSLKKGSAVLQPGDLLESNQHIVLVVGVDEDAGQYLCAEAAGNSDGVLFTRRSFADSGYWGVKMDGFYDNSANIRSE